MLRQQELARRVHVSAPNDGRLGLAKLSPMAITTRARLRLGSLLVALSYGVAGLAAYAILAAQPDLSNRSGRHLLAGALAIGSLSAVEVLIAIFSLSRGERWAFWAALLPLLSLVVPVMAIDATHVASDHLFVTLTPFVAGLILAISGLTLAGWRGKE